MNRRLMTTIILAALSAAAPAQAQDAAAPVPTLDPVIHGHVNATYNFNLMDPAGDINLFHSYDAVHNTFMLNAAHLAIGGSDDRLSYMVEVDAGTDAIVDSADDDFDIQEAYVSYVGANRVGVKAGKFATFHGIEVIESPANPTVSRGFLFGLAEPFTHTGAVITYKASDTIDFAVGAINGWDLVVDNNDMKTFVGKLGVTLPTLGLIVSAHAGPEQPDNDKDWRFSFDVTGVSKMNKLDLWFQGNVGMEQNVAGGDDATWYGAGVQPVFHLNDKMTLGARAEVFADPDGARTGVPGGVTLVNLSAAPSIAIYKTFALRPEARVDIASEDVYIQDDGDAGSLQLIVALEALATF
jgi:hypothetical protein